MSRTLRPLARVLEPLAWLPAFFTSLALLATEPGTPPSIEGLPAEIELEADSATPVEPARVAGSAPLSFLWQQILRSPVTPNPVDRPIPVPESEDRALGRHRWLERHTGRYRLTVSNAWGTATDEVQVQVRRPQQPAILAQPLRLNLLAGSPLETPLILDGRPPLTTAWWLDGVRLNNQFLAAPVLPSRPGFTGGTLIAVVSNRFGSATSQPVVVSIVGTNLHRQDFNGRTAPGWTPTFSQGSTNENRWGRSGFTTRPGTFRLTNSLPMGTVVLGFDVWAQDSWDGEDAIFGPDRWSLSVEGVPLFAAAFSNNDDRRGPSYLLQRFPIGRDLPQIAPRLGSLGPDPTDSDWGTMPEYMGRVRVSSPYRLRFAVTNRTEVFAADFVGEGIGDESWALDNFYISRLPADLAWIRVGVPAVSASEEDGEVSIPLERLGNLDLAVEVRVVTQDASAVADVDYLPFSGKIRFEPGESRKSVPIQVIGNRTEDPPRSFGVWLLDAGTNGVFLGQPFAAVAIRDDESTLRLVVETNRIPSGARTVVGHLERTGDLTHQISVAIHHAPGTALLGEDFLPFGVVTNVGWAYFEIGSTRAIPRLHYTRAPLNPLEIVTPPDAAWEGPESFTLRLDDGYGIATSPDTSMEVTVFPAVARLRIEPVDPVSGNAAWLRIELPPGTSGRLEHSVDLREWTPLETVTGTRVRPIETGSGGFYRIRPS
jgi:hypothetical protein